VIAVQKWFEDAKLGIFIHYGIYAVDGVMVFLQWAHVNMYGGSGAVVTHN